MAKRCRRKEIELAFLAKAKIRHFWCRLLSALVKDSRQFKQREKRLLLKVVTVNLPLYKQLQY